MLSDLTLLIWVPIFLWIVAQRKQRKIPRFQLAQPGFLLEQSAHRSLPATVLINSCKARSFLACCLLLIADAMVGGFAAAGSS